MAKQIVPHKLIITLNEDWTVQSTILSYRIKEDGAMNSQKYYTTNVDNGIDTEKLADIMAASKSHAEQGEGIT